MDWAFYAALRRAVERKEEKHWRWVAALAGAGVPLISTWHDWRPNHSRREPTDSEWIEHSARCLAQASSADICILFYESEHRHFGSLLEAGAALGAGKWVYVASDISLPFLMNHPKVRTFRTLAEAVRALR
jgi:hypothetical protein